VRTPASVLAEILRSDPARPRVTFYEDTPGPTQGERIELSGKTVANWISKAGNALQDEYDLGPGSVVRLSLPPHWRALYWAFAVWSVGGTVDCSGGPTADSAGGPTADSAGGPTADLLICDGDEDATTLAPPSGDVVLVTLAALARVHAGPVPPGAMDEARDLATYGDQFSALADPSPENLAMITKGERTTYRSVVPARGWPAGARVSLAGNLAEVLASTLAAWAVDGSVVLARNGEHAGSERQPERLASEGVTVELTADSA
jgi:alkylated DNA nucleotide flippase Atl1